MAEAAPNDGVVITFARSAAFDLDAIKRAAYRFSDRVSVEITEADSGYTCILRKLRLESDLDPKRLEGEFRNEVLDQELRLQVAAETADYRNLVLSLAFSKTPLGQ